MLAGPKAGLHGPNNWNVEKKRNLGNLRQKRHSFSKALLCCFSFIITIVNRIPEGTCAGKTRPSLLVYLD